MELVALTMIFNSIISKVFQASLNLVHWSIATRCQTSQGDLVDLVDLVAPVDSEGPVDADLPASAPRPND